MKKIKNILKVNPKLYRMAKKFQELLPDKLMQFQHHLEIIGGKAVCLDMIPHGSTIISGGVGNDIEFERQLIVRKGVKVIGFDPTDTAENFISSFNDDAVKSNYFFNKKAISEKSENIRIYYGDDDFMVSTSSQHQNVLDQNSKLCEAVAFEEILHQYPNASYVKLDIEGPEYAIIEKLQNINISQISIEFHHHCDPNYTILDTIKCVEKLKNMGYDVFDYGGYHGRKRRLPRYISKWSDLNCEFLFIKR
jgi:FkbM family methyltransferase